jgi:hypothetical protein
MSKYSIGYWTTYVIIFVGCWIYCIAHYGFLLGVGLGWLPAMIVATVASFFWPLYALAAFLGVLLLLNSSVESSRRAHDSAVHMLMRRHSVEQNIRDYEAAPVPLTNRNGHILGAADYIRGADYRRRLEEEKQSLDEQIRVARPSFDRRTAEFERLLNQESLTK